MRIFLDKKEIMFGEKHLPMVIHGKDGSGASLYTLTLAANFYARGSKILFLCGFPMAHEEFLKQAGNDDRATFCVKEEVERFRALLEENNDLDDTLIVIKNIELFSEDIFDLASAKRKCIVSGDVGKSPFKEKILAKKYSTKIFYSPLEGEDVPPLEKYHGFLFPTTCGE